MSKVKVTRNESKKIMEGIRNTKIGKELAELGSIIGSFSNDLHYGNPFEAAFNDNVLSTQEPVTLSYGPAFLYRVHDKGENGARNMQYLGQEVIITEIQIMEFFGVMYKCKYAGTPELDGEYVNNTMFTSYHLKQNPNNYYDFYDEEEALKFIRSDRPDGYVAQGTLQEDDDGVEFWRCMVWKEE